MWHETEGHTEHLSGKTEFITIIIIIDRLIFSANADSLRFKRFCWVCNFSRTKHKTKSPFVSWDRTYTELEPILGFNLSKCDRFC